MQWKGQVVIFSPEERKKARAENREVFGKSGVYLYVNENKNEKTASIYVGQARHLDSRADDPKRFTDDDGSTKYSSIVLITREDDLQMDENWRQHLEHLLIDNLTDRSKRKGFVCENRTREPASYATKKERGIIESWYSELEKELEMSGIAGFDSRNFFAPVTQTYHCESGKSARTKIFKAKCEYSEVAGTVHVLKDSYAAIGRCQVAVTHQRVKSNLIEKGVLIEAKLNGKDCYRFSQDFTFSSKSEATAVIVNSPRSWNDNLWFAE